MADSVIGEDFVPPDVHSKVTGRAKYAEDARADGMLFCRLLLSPMPHGRVRSIDASEALAMDGVFAVLDADDLPAVDPPETPILTNEPCYVGEPILAVAAVDEATAQNAIDTITVDLEPLPFTVDPLQSLRPDGPNARSDGNAVVRREGVRGVREIKWTTEDFDAAGDGALPVGEPTVEWSYGDVDGGFQDSALVLDETFVTAGLSHHSMEPRTAMAYWQNGKCFVYGSTQSQAFVIPGLARLIGIAPENLVYIAEYCGGGFGSKGGAYPVMAIPAHLSKRTGRPVMLRITRAEEYYTGSARPGFQGRIKIGFRADGRVAAVDLYLVQENGPYAGFGDYTSAADAVSIVYTPVAMRFQGIAVATNTPPRGAQRGPGQNQIAVAVEPLIDKAARHLGLDRVAIRRVNAPDHDSRYGGGQSGITSAYLSEALDKGRARFDWDAKQAQSGRRRGSKVIGIGVGQAYHSAGSNGFDGLVRIAPDGTLHIHTGVGNLGTYSYASTARVAADVLKYQWDHCVIERGSSERHLPWNLGQFGSNTSFTMTRTNYAAAIDAVGKLKDIAAQTLGGSPDDYDIGDERVFRRTMPAAYLTYAAAAQRAIELGGRFSGQVLADDLNSMTKTSARALAGTGLIGVAKDTLPREGTVPALAAGFVQIELDLETGKFDILEYVGVADCGTVLHPQGLANQIKGGAVMGFSMACLERHVYDSHYGLPGSIGLHQAKPATYLDVPLRMEWDAVDAADPQNPSGAKGVGEPLLGCAAAALLCAISDALGGHYFNRTPVVADMIINAVWGRGQSHTPLQVNTA